MNTPLTFKTPPTNEAQIGSSDLFATVLQCKDPDVAVGQRVKVTGYIAIVNSITRRDSMGLARVQEDSAHAFDLGDLQFDDQGASFVLASVKERIIAALKTTNLTMAPEMTLIDRVESLCRRYNVLHADSERKRVDDLPEDTYMLPKEWATLLGHDVLDWDGWNDMQRNLTVACTRQDFNERINKCTIKNLAQMVNPAKRDRAMDNFLAAASPQIKRTSTTKTPCCNYAIDVNTPGPIFWNEFNKVVQCHNCGQVFEAGYTRAADMDTGPLSEGAQIEQRMEPDQPAPLSKQRNRLPDTRYALTHKFDCGGQKGYVTVGFYDLGDLDGGEMDLSRPGEVFVVVQRQGSTLQGFADAWARSVSMLLQYGVPVSEVCRMFAYHRFEPRGITPNPDIRIAYSIVDYVARWLGHTCIEGYQPGGANELAADLSNEN